MFERFEDRRLAAGFDFTNNGIIDIRDVDSICFAYDNHVREGLPLEFFPDRQKYDVNGDGAFDIRDVDFVLSEQWGTTRGDVNLDGAVDVEDLAQVWESNPQWRRAEDPGYQDGAHEAYGRYSSGNFFCDFEGIRPLPESLFGLDRGIPAEMFAYFDGDYNTDGVFDSSDIVELYTTGHAGEVETEELIAMFQMGHYQQ